MQWITNEYLLNCFFKIVIKDNFNMSKVGQDPTMQRRTSERRRSKLNKAGEGFHLNNPFKNGVNLKSGFMPEEVVKQLRKLEYISLQNLQLLNLNNSPISLPDDNLTRMKQAVLAQEVKYHSYFDHPYPEHNPEQKEQIPTLQEVQMQEQEPVQFCHEANMFSDNYQFARRESLHEIHYNPIEQENEYHPYFLN